VYGVDRSGRITFVNDAAVRALRFAGAHDLVGQLAHARFHRADVHGHPVSPETCFLQQAYELGDSLSNWETAFWCADGQPLSVECNLRPQYRDGECIGVVAAFRDIAERKRYEAEMQWQLRHDHLTKLYNRRYFEELLEQEVLRLRRSSEQSALLFIDLDRFKHINDTAGHAAGDALLVMIGQRLLSRARQSDAVARLAGDEFAVLLRHVDEHKVADLAETFRAILDNTSFGHAGREFEVSGSVGFVLLDRHISSAAHAINCADAACHVAKQQGRSRINRFHSRDGARAIGALQQSWSQRLRRALDTNAFTLYYQPIVDLECLGESTGRAEDGDALLRRSTLACCAHEVLLRLDDLGTRLEPRAFLSQAERFNLLPALDTWVLQRVAARLACDDGAPARFNVAAATLLDENYVDALAALGRQGVFAAGRLSLELKESELALQAAKLLPAMRQIAALGVRFVLDEFGRGFGSVEQLRNLPIAAVKLDAALVQGIARDPFGAALVRAMASLARAMDLTVIAPGIEDATLLPLLRAEGLDWAQGYALGRPHPLAARACESPLA
jgi:diguanylate cyclase (GGDEF)-like protein